jgi:capsular polysaccharide transport system permease protein
VECVVADLSESRRFSNALGSWLSVISYLMVREFDQKFRGNRLSVLLAVAEPVLLISLMIMLRGLFRGQFPAYGLSTAVFYSSGVFPFYTFMRLSYRARQTKYDTSQRLPRVSATALLIASAIAEATLILSTMLAWFGALWLYGLEEAAPYSIPECAKPILLLMTFGIGVGLINSALSRRFALWSYLYGRLTRGLMLLSGVFVVADLLPYFARSILIWNPLLHGIEWFRLGLYGTYPVHTLDRDYLMTCAGISLFVGVISYRATLRTPRR